MVAFKHLGVIATTRPRHGQIRDLPHRRLQITPVVSIALISTLLVALVGQGPDEGCHFLLQHTHQGYTNRLLQPLAQHLLKRFLTSSDGFAIVLCVSHGYPPGDLTDNYVPVLGYQTPLLHNTQYTANLDKGSMHFLSLFTRFYRASPLFYHNFTDSATRLNVD